MKILKKRFKKVKVKIKPKLVPGGDKLGYKPHTTIRIPLKPIKIKKKLGRWCEYYEGRLPFPIECSNNKAMPTSYLFKGRKKIKIRDNSNCPGCVRNPSFISWKRGDWRKIIEAIKNGEDLTDMDPPTEGMG